MFKTSLKIINLEKSIYTCKCICGNIKKFRKFDFDKGKIKSCGCLKYKSNIDPGTKFNKLTTISYKNKKWFCLCDCGESTIVTSTHLKSGNTKSCGCLKVEENKRIGRIKI
jgi:hypothetical protein